MFSRTEKVQKEVDPTFREAAKTQPPSLHVPVAERYGLRVKPNPGAGNCGMHVVHERSTALSSINIRACRFKTFATAPAVPVPVGALPVA